MKCHGSREVAYCAVLTASFGQRLVTIGNFRAPSVVGYRGFERTLPPVPTGSVAEPPGRVGAPFYILDLRKAPAAYQAGEDGGGYFSCHAAPK
jgi:hypothetical protein